MKCTHNGGHNPQSNGSAEFAVGEICRISRRVVSHIGHEPTVRALWAHATHWAGIRKSLQYDRTGARIRPDDLLPFGSLVLVKTNSRAGIRKHHDQWQHAINLAVSDDVSGGSVVALITSSLQQSPLLVDKVVAVLNVHPVLTPVQDEGECSTTRNSNVWASEQNGNVNVRAEPTDGKYIFPDVYMELSEKDLRWSKAKEIVCQTCGMQRYVESGAYEKLMKRK